jgi:hypothetical protein
MFELGGANMIRALMVATFGMLLVSSVAAEESGESVPKTYDGSGDAFKEGGREIGEGFKSLGRGVRDTFTGQEAKEDYKNTKSIGEGAKDIGRGVAGGARATGETVKDAVDGEEK